jgi:hypothetical protein
VTPALALVAALALLAQFAAWMVWRNLMVWQPVVARLSGSDYREAEQNFDSMLNPMTSNIGWALGTTERDRLTECWFRYEDQSGKTHSVQLTRITARGYNPDGSIVLWYDPRNPERCTRFGPGFWAIMGIASAGALIWLFTRGAALLSLPAQ